MRQIIIVLVLLLIVAVAIWSLMNWENRKALHSDPWDAIPERSAVIVSIPDAWVTWDRFSHTSQLWESFQQIPSFKAAGDLMAATIDRMQNDAALREALKGTPVVVAVMRGGSDRLGALFIGAPGANTGTPLSAFAEILKLDNATKAALSKGDVVLVRPDTILPSLSLCLRDNAWLMATTPQVMEEALLQLTSGVTIKNDSSLARVYGTIGGGADAHAFVHMRRTARMLDLWIDPEAVGDIEILDGWAALDLRARPDAILMSGLVAPETETKAFTSLSDQGTGRLDVARVLPGEVSAIDAWQVSDPMEWLVVNHGEYHEPELSAALFNWIHGTVGRAWAITTDGSIQRWAFFRAGDPEDASQAILSLCDPAIPCEQLEYRGNVLHRLPVNNAIPRLLGDDSFEHFKNAWWTILGDVVIWSADPAALRSSIDVWHDGNSLAEEARANAWFQRISDSAGRLLWCDPARSATLMRSLVKPAAIPEWTGYERAHQLVGGLSIQISPGQRGFYNVVAGIQHAGELRQGTGVLWDTDVGAIVQRRPDIVRNHNNNTNEVLVQDITGRIHLIGSTGKVLWTRQLDGEIMGRVKQVDRFRNGKLQMLFNTERKIYLIDRNGKDVGDLPIDLREKAAAPLAVFDYDGANDHRILIPTQDARLLNYGLDGKEVKGWERPLLGATAACATHHIRIKNKDYLILADVQGRIHILDRRGMIRERTALSLGVSPAIEQIIPGPDIMTSAVVWKDTAGVMWQGSFNGPVIELAQAGGTIKSLDLDADGTFEQVRIVNDTLIATHEENPLYTRSFGVALGDKLEVHSLGAGQQALSVLRTEAGKVSLLDHTGRDLPGSPLNGMISPAIADLNLDDVFELVTATSDGKVIAYSLNGTSGTR